MGCGRSTLGSDSPKKKKKKNEVESDCDSDGDSTSSGGGGGGGGGGSRNKQLSNKLVGVGVGGPLLAQAKISESQQDFFMMLDEKIENGPDYDSETEEAEKRRRLQQEYAQQWGGTLSNSQAATPTNDPSTRLPDEDTCGSGDITEEDEEEDEEPGRIPDEAVKEQYMFMGNLYTLTHIRTDSDTTEQKVEKVEKVDEVTISPPRSPKEEEEEDEEDEEGHKLNGSAVQGENGVSEEDDGDGGGGGDDSVVKQVKTSPKTSRPASLILRSAVLPDSVVQE